MEKTDKTHKTSKTATLGRKEEWKNKNQASKKTSNAGEPSGTGQPRPDDKSVRTIKADSKTATANKPDRKAATAAKPDKAEKPSKAEKPKSSAQPIPKNDAAGQMQLEALQQKQKLCGMVGLAMKAGKVIAGAELVTAAVRTGSPKKCPRCVFLAADASANTIKRIRNCCDFYEVPLETLSLSSAVLGSAIGKTGLTAVIGINDERFCDAVYHHNQSAVKASE